MKRRGISLIEMVIVITAVSGVALLGGRMFNTLLRGQRSAARSLVETVAMSRFAHDFRRDVHAAVAVDLQADAACRLQTAEDGQIVYRVAGSVLQRTESRGNGVQSRERYAFPPGVAAFESTAGARLITFKYLWRPAPANESVRDLGTAREFRIVAALARDQRFDQSQKRPERADGAAGDGGD